MMEKQVIEVENLTAGYGDVTILEKVSFHVNHGEIFVIIGGSGCGKSTLLKHLIGLKDPISGRITILGNDLAGSGRKERADILQRIGVAFQSGALFGSMNVLENICFPLKHFSRLPIDAIQNVARIKLSLVGLENAGHLMPSELSGGMKKRAALARAMALDPSIVFLDEPSAGLDPVTSAELDQLVRTLALSLGITFIIVTHELASIETISDRIIMLEKTQRGIIAEGTFNQLKHHSTIPDVQAFFNRTSNPIPSPQGEP